MITMNDLTKNNIKDTCSVWFYEHTLFKKDDNWSIIRVFNSKSEYDQAVSNLEKSDGDCKYILLSELEMIWNNLQ